MQTCPTCDSHDLTVVELAYGADFRPDVHGVVPVTGDSIAACGTCHDFEVLAPVKSKAKAKSKAKVKSKAKAKSKTSAKAG